MIDKFIISKVRIKILNLFLTNSATSFHVREIVRKTDEEINAVRRILKDFESINFLKSEKNSNRLYYTVNQTHIYFNDLSSLINKEFGVGERILKHKAKIGNIKIAFLTSTFMEGKRKNKEDLELIIVGEIIDEEYLNKLVSEGEKEIGREINYTYMTLMDFSKAKNGADSTMRNIIYNRKIILIGNEMDIY
ncbi:hypothetical protein M1145_00610 [Patescibacteria group bacterium]|nr:hypothetical protein [Patescibacteria group bacterium]